MITSPLREITIRTMVQLAAVQETILPSRTTMAQDIQYRLVLVEANTTQTAVATKFMCQRDEMINKQ